MMSSTWWQRSRRLVGWPRDNDPCNSGQEDTRRAAESYIVEHGGSVLDVGCNFGTLAARLRRAGHAGHYVGVDSNQRAIAAARRWLDVEAYVADASRMPFPDASFDIVYMKDIIEHQADYEPILAECGRVAKEVLVVSMFIRLSCEPDRIVWDPKGYYMNRYNRERFYGSVKRAGFAAAPAVLFSASTVDGEDEVLMFARPGSQ